MKKLLLFAVIGCSIQGAQKPAPAVKFELPGRDYDQKLQNQFVDAVRKGNFPQVQRMLKFRPKISVNGSDDNLETPLGVAALMGNHDIAALLLDHGANPNAQKSGGLGLGISLPLFYYIVKNGDLKMVELFLTHGAQREYTYVAAGKKKTMKFIDEVPSNHPNTQKLKELLGKSRIL